MPQQQQQTDSQEGEHADRQTLLVAPNIISQFKNLDCRENVYWGSSAISSHTRDREQRQNQDDERDQRSNLGFSASSGVGAHLESKAYGLSWPLVRQYHHSRLLPTDFVRRVQRHETMRGIQS
jgi:hypothetical protein